MGLITIHTFGDSHCGFPKCNWNNIKIDGVKIISHRIGPVTCRKFGVKKLDVLDISRFGVKDGDIVCFSFGEIDVRAHMDKHKYQYKSYIDYLVVKYFLAIEENIFNFGYLQVIVSCIVPVAYDINDPNYPTLGSNEERKAYTEYMNLKIKEGCSKRGYIYLDVYNDYCNEDGYLNMVFADGHVHIKDAKFLEIQLRKILNEL